ncbi:FAD/NAD(P)-binding domain-containing protein [Lophium mytilinum]|uniref:FAD/NAD(P)-binding domain-containing protein n=1 Tax=Lophium mytilinum TaxID=390894 RepID=A0A6A6QFP3_9PEZI|nr:FAD/NAD(P)-binding domain-containing protein [Lophium mytilinum]
MTTESMHDVLIIGAGISGINTAYRLQQSLPNATYAIVDGRNNWGGTWDLFKFPGIRSDSDLFTFGFSWEPWTARSPIATGESIQTYLRHCISKHGIDKHAIFQHHVVAADWSSETQLWRLETSQNGQKKYLYGRHVVLGTGYYDYEDPLAAKIPGLENFKGDVLHPQFWPEGFDYSGKKVVIIGSGATAITIVPAMAEKAAKVTMLQRSPSYVLPVPIPKEASFVEKWAPTSLARMIVRFQHIWGLYLVFFIPRWFPNWSRKFINDINKEELKGSSVPIDPHFIPKYKPWDQRVCYSPDGDFWAAFRSGKADVATGVIKTVTDTSITLESGQQLDADIIVTATGLRMRIGGGIQISVDGTQIINREKFLWRYMMIQDVPNMYAIVGYTAFSWTLGADATGILMMRLLKHLQKNGYSSVTPRCSNPNQKQSPIMGTLNSTYVTSAASSGVLFKTGTEGPWHNRVHYLQDLWRAYFASITADMEFSKVST